jgi:ribose transport system substrate-binding protein
MTASRSRAGRVLAVGALAALLLPLAACGSSDSSTSKAGASGGSSAGSAGGSSGGGSGKKLKIALSNSFIGNKWRVEMENDFKSVCASPPWKDQIDCTIYNAGNDVSKQSQQMSNLISQRVDAIVLNAASPTGLNGVVKQACARKILVVSFDSTVTEPCGIKVNTDQVKFGSTLAQFLVDNLPNGGNVIEVTGVAGTSVDADRNEGAKQVFAQAKNIKVVSTYTGMWDTATAQRNTAGQIPSLPKIDGIWAQGGTDGVLKAFLDAKRPLPVTAGEAENGFRKFMRPEGYQGAKVKALSIGQPPYLGVVALQTAIDVLNGKRKKADVMVPFPQVKNSDIKTGETVFPNLEDSFFTTFTDAGSTPTVKICVDAALTGKACPEPPTITLPPAA